MEAAVERLICANLAPASIASVDPAVVDSKIQELENMGFSDEVLVFMLHIFLLFIFIPTRAQNHFQYDHLISL